jgi:hypothetical protein
VRDDHVRLLLDQLGSEAGEPVPLVVSKAILQAESLSLDVPEFAQALHKRRKTPFGVRKGF